MTAEWRAYARQLGVPCPSPSSIDAAIALETPWAFLSPDSAEAKRAHIAAYAVEIDEPCLAPRARMAPIFNRDGDTLLLGSDGAIRIDTFSSAIENHGLVAASFDELLGQLERDAAAEDDYNDNYESANFHGTFVDGFEFMVSSGHRCVRIEGGWSAASELHIGLSSRHLRGAMGSGPGLTIHLLDTPLLDVTGYRTEPSRFVRRPGEVLDLGDQAVITRFIEHALRVGWTGRNDTEPLVIADGWSVR